MIRVETKVAALAELWGDDEYTLKIEQATPLGELSITTVGKDGEPVPTFDIRLDPDQALALSDELRRLVEKGRGG
jgi:hypothetical protein